MPLGGPNPNAWNHWYHCVGSTYGTWLRGDPRGFRTYRHREHVDGDYRHPPPDIYRPVLERSRKEMAFPPVLLDSEQRRVACDAMTEKLNELRVEVLAASVAVNHFHLLARFPVLEDTEASRRRHTVLRDGRDPGPRHFLGLARKHASHVLRQRGVKAAGPLWAARPRCVPIRDRRHQVNTLRYIEHHVDEGAAVWCLGTMR